MQQTGGGRVHQGRLLDWSCELPGGRRAVEPMPAGGRAQFWSTFNCSLPIWSRLLVSTTRLIWSSTFDSDGGDKQIQSRDEESILHTSDVTASRLVTGPARRLLPWSSVSTESHSSFASCVPGRVHSPFSWPNI